MEKLNINNNKILIQEFINNKKKVMKLLNLKIMMILLFY